ncbi:MAG: hypothetical protein ABJA10_08460 [Aestuariivirga sp.]
MTEYFHYMGQLLYPFFGIITAGLCYIDSQNYSADRNQAIPVSILAGAVWPLIWLVALIRFVAR